MPVETENEICPTGRRQDSMTAVITITLNLLLMEVAVFFFTSVGDMFMLCRVYVNKNM
jgi:hypothetical protein